MTFNAVTEVELSDKSDGFVLNTRAQRGGHQERLLTKCAKERVTVPLLALHNQPFCEIDRI